MGGQIFKICALAIICGAVGIVIRQIKNEMSFGVRAAGGVLIFGMIMISAEPLLRSFSEMSKLGAGVEYIEIMLKALGVALVAHVCAGICRDCGEAGIAGGVELAGKIEILLLCLPLIERILGYASEIISMQG